MLLFALRGNRGTLHYIVVLNLEALVSVLSNLIILHLRVYWDLDSCFKIFQQTVVIAGFLGLVIGSSHPAMLVNFCFFS